MSIYSLARTALPPLDPIATASAALGVAFDPTRPKSELLLENALLPQQLVILHRHVQKSRFTSAERLWIVVLASRLPRWSHVLLIFKPDTLLRSHREGLRLFLKLKSRSRRGRPQVIPEIITLIQRLATANRLWGAERIRGELLKLGLHVPKGTIQKYIASVRPSRSASQNWSIFIHNHAQAIWARDFLPVIDRFFHPLYHFFIIELASRRVVHFSVTRSPSDAWVAQQLHEATPFGRAPRFLIRDRDQKYGASLRASSSEHLD